MFFQWFPQEEDLPILVGADEILEKAQNNIIAMIVENKPGVLFRVTNMIRRKGFNIESISVDTNIDEGKFARMVLVLKGDSKTIEQITKNLRKLVETMKVTLLEPEESVIRELALIKIHAEEPSTRADVQSFTEAFRGRVVDISFDSMMVEVTGNPEKINAYINLVKRFGIKEVGRTGITALPRASKLKTASYGPGFTGKVPSED